MMKISSYSNFCMLFILSCLVGKTQTSKKLPFSYIFEFATDEVTVFTQVVLDLVTLWCRYFVFYQHYNPITPIILGVGMAPTLRIRWKKY